MSLHETYLKYQIFQTKALERENTNCRTGTETAMHTKTGQAANINLINIIVRWRTPNIMSSEEPAVIFEAKYYSYS